MPTSATQPALLDDLTPEAVHLAFAELAEETSRMARSQILAQAGVSVLAQANQGPQLALKLLG